MEIDDRIYSATKACRAAGVQRFLLNAWRARYGLFGDAQRPGWQRYSVEQICVLRTIVVLTNQGIDAPIAIASAQRAEPGRPLLDMHLGAILRGWPNLPPYALVHAGKKILWSFGRDSDSLAAAMNRSEGIATIIDLRMVTAHVIRELGLERTAA